MTRESSPPPSTRCLAAISNPWHTSGSSSLQSSRTCSCQSCTCGQSQAPKGRQDWGLLTMNRLRATPANYSTPQTKTYSVFSE